jgi:methyl-accepting chemotaxis protein
MDGKAIKKTRGSIAVTLTLTVIAIFITVQSILWAGFLVSQKTLFAKKLAGKAEEITSLVAKVSSRSIREGRATDLKLYLDEVVDGEDIINVKVIDSSGSLIAHADGMFKEQGLNLWPFYMKWSDMIIKPVVINGEVAGKVVLTYSGKSVNDDMLYLLLVPPLWQALVFIVIIVLIFVYISKYIGRPIDIIKGGMTKITSGDLTVDIPDMGGREISEIADGLRYLVKGLSVNVLRLKRVTKGISCAIGALKSTFKTATDRVKAQSATTNHIAGTMKLADESQGKIKDNAQRLSQLINENLSSVLEIKSREEEMHTNMEQLFRSVDNSYSVVAEMSQTSKGMMENASRVLGSVENTSASVDEIIASVKEVETNARESSRLAEDVRKLAAHKGIATVEKAINGMNMISSKVTLTVDIVRKLDKRSNDVKKVLTFIKDITEKTNMLSINASILAEQAGEQGKGFAVVAEQMRSLSTGTEGYTKEISAIVTKIQSDIGEVVSAIVQGNEMVKVGSDAVYEVGETMSSILESSHSSANMTKMIEQATEDQVLALRHIESSIVEVNRMSMEMDRAMAEMYKSSGYLFDNMGEVRDVAELTMKGSNELVEAVKFISQNLEKSADDVSGIEDAISLQKYQVVDILGGVESIRNEGVWIINDLEGLSDSIEGLRTEFDTLKGEMDSFKVK